MSDTDHVWPLVLAAGDGSRLRALTTKPCGTAVPKQYCSLRGGHSLLEDAMSRAASLVPLERICAIVAQQHRQWWLDLASLQRLPSPNLIVQPRNRGTGIGILYSVLHIAARDPRARVLLLPADHYVRDEHVLQNALALALERVARDPRQPVLLGLEPDETDTELGYILPQGPDPMGGQTVARFVEKPDAAMASEVIAAGGLWNTFIIAASAQSLIDMFLPRHAALVMEMQIIVSKALHGGSPTAGWPAIVDMYERLPHLDFSRDLLEGKEARLRVMRVPPCGWSDLGTPRRVGETLRRLRPRQHDHAAYEGAHERAFARSSLLDLAAQHERFVGSSQHVARA